MNNYQQLILDDVLNQLHYLMESKQIEGKIGSIEPLLSRVWRDFNDDLDGETGAFELFVASLILLLPSL